MDLPPDFAKHAAGPAGSLTAALLFMAGVPWPRRIGMVVAGSALAYYGTTAVATFASLPDGLAGYLLGLFGMAAVAKVFATWDALDLGTLLRKAVAKMFGVTE
jgi:membrane protein YqaA with SNARE-associated domain